MIRDLSWVETILETTELELVVGDESPVEYPDEKGIKFQVAQR